MMDIETGRIASAEEWEKMLAPERAKFTPIPEQLSIHAQALLEWRDQLRKEKARKRNRIARATRRKNRSKR